MYLRYAQQVVFSFLAALLFSLVFLSLPLCVTVRARFQSSFPSSDRKAPVSQICSNHGGLLMRSCCFLTFIAMQRLKGKVQVSCTGIMSSDVLIMTVTSSYYAYK